MPIRFRCVYCDKLLGIARRKAGAVVGCPHCGEKLVVPTPDESAPAHVPAGDHHEEVPEPVAIQPPPLPPAPSPRVKDTPPAPPPAPGKGVPLFERSDFEELLNPEPTFRSGDDLDSPPPAPRPQAQAPAPKKPPAPAPKPVHVEPPRPLEPLSLDDAPQRGNAEGIFISRSKMTWISVLGVLLFAAVFGVGIAVGRMLR